MSHVCVLSFVFRPEFAEKGGTHGQFKEVHNTCESTFSGLPLGSVILASPRPKTKKEMWQLLELAG